MPLLSRRWLAVAVTATVVYVLISVVVWWAGIDTNIDTGDNVAKGALLIALATAAACWLGLLFHALRIVVVRLLRGDDVDE